jgi:hypothetical protein
MRQVHGCTMNLCTEDNRATSWGVSGLRASHRPLHSRRMPIVMHLFPLGHML